MGFLKKFKSSTKQKSKRSKSLPTNDSNLEQDDENLTGRHAFSCVSLGTGSFCASGVLSLSASLVSRSPSPNGTESVGSLSDGEEAVSIDEHNNHRKLTRQPSRVFIRTADLPHMKAAAIESRHSSFSELADDELIDHVHCPSSNPPLPSIEHDPNESWVALDDGNGNKSPLAEAAMTALVRTSLDASMDKSMWTANGATAKLLKTGIWDETIFMPCERSRPMSVPHAKGSKGEMDVLVWSGAWAHKYYGHDIPAIRCEAIVNMSPQALASLLMDSTRVKEYNKMSVGRDEILVLHDDEKRITKVMVGRSKPPMLGKTLMLKSLMHMEELPGGSEQGGYVVVSRAVAHVDDDEAVEDPKVIHSEMLMGLNVIRCVEGEPDRCVLVNLNHLRSPLIPMMFAKKLGLSAAVNFINDIRALC